MALMSMNLQSLVADRLLEGLLINSRKIAIARRVLIGAEEGIAWWKVPAR